MRELAATAERLRQVRRAQREFLGLWAAECLTAKPRSWQRVAKDLLNARDGIGGEALMNGHDWAVLYRGSVLDD